MLKRIGWSTSGVALFATLLALAACSEDGGNGGTPQDDVGIGGGDTEQPTGDTGSLDQETGEPIKPPQSLVEIIVLHDTTIPQQVDIQDDFVIRAKVIDYAKGAPASEVEVSYEIVSGADHGDGSLASKVAYSDEHGEVQNTFRGGYTGEVSYRVKLSAGGAEDRYIDIIVSDTDKGSVEVHLDYEGPINVNTIKVRLMPKSFICGQFHPTGAEAGSLADKTVLSIADTPVFDGLSAGSHFTLIATAKSPTGALAAAGCKDGVFVVADQKTPATLTLHLLPLNPTGSYDVDNVFDFTNALGNMGTVGEVIQGIVTLFNNPGKFLIDQIKSLVAAFVGDLIADAAFGLFEDELADIINDWVKDDAPEWLQDFFTLGDDLTQIVDHLHLKSVLKISKLQNDYYFQGTQFWNGIVLTWKLDCDPEAPDYDECGKMEFSMEDFGNTQFPQDIIEGYFTGSIANYDKLNIDQHAIQISYGKLILFVLNEVILKSITGENTIKDAVLKFVNCPGIASLFSNGVLDALGLTEDKLTSYCESTIGLLIAPLEDYIGGLALDSQLKLTGQCTLVDDTDDLKIDRLIDGKYSGEIEVDAQSGSSFTGTFEGTKQALPMSPIP